MMNDSGVKLCAYCQQYAFSETQVKEMLAKAVAEEREACAKLVESLAPQGPVDGWISGWIANRVANEIRGR